MKKNIRLHRKTAQRLLEELKGRASAINANPRLPQYVQQMAVFGSYVNSNKKQLGDLDVLVQISDKPGRTNDHINFFNNHRQELKLRGTSFCEQMFACYLYVRRQLQARSTALSLHDWNELDFTTIRADDRQVFFQSQYEPLFKDTVRWYQNLIIRATNPPTAVKRS